MTAVSNFIPVVNVFCPVLQNLQQSQRALLSVRNSAQGILTTLMTIIPTHLPYGTCMWPHSWQKGA